MPVAILNVHLSYRTNLDIVRIDNRNRDVALNCLNQEVLLYAPAHEPKPGYFGLARIVDVNPDLVNRRFMYLRLDEIRLFASPIAHEELSVPIESRGYGRDRKIRFSYFSTGIRDLTPEDRDAARDLANGRLRQRGVDTPQAPFLGIQPQASQYRLRYALERDRRLRWEVLEIYGSACAVCGDDDAIREIGACEVEVCHLHALNRGWPDTLTNALPMCRKHHWAFDNGLFTLEDGGFIMPSKRMAPQPLVRFNGRRRARYPEAEAARPKDEHIRFHRENVFRR